MFCFIKEKSPILCGLWRFANAYFMSFVSEDVKDNRWIYVITMMVTLSLFVVAKWFALNKSYVILLSIYLFIGILFGFGIILGTISRPDEQTVTFVALLLTVPLLFTDRPIRMICNIYVYIFLFVIVAVHTKVDYVLVADVIDACIFGTISSIVSTYMMSVKCQRYLYEQKAIRLSEMDLLTGLRNRNAYEKNLSEYTSLCRKSLTCIFVDVNGLHELNNEKGHEAGDKMLQFIAGRLQEQFGKKHTYRIGGDEFVAFVPDLSAEKVKEKIGWVVKEVEQRNYHISIGYDTGVCSELEILSMVKNAEKYMYAAKRKYYQNKEFDRRAR